MVSTNEKPDILWGASEIAAAIGRPPTAVFHLLQIGALPARKVGGRWCASREKLLAALIQEEAKS